MLPQQVFIELNLDTTNKTYFFVLEKDLYFFLVCNTNIAFPISCRL
jgi:hypothetical protein